MTEAANRPEFNESGPEPEGGSFNPLEYVNILLRRRWLIILGTFLAVGVAAVYLKLQTPMYQASIKVLPSREQAMSSRIDASFGLNRTNQQGYEQTDVATQYYQELLTSFPFLEKIVRKKTHLGAADREFDLIEYYRVTGLDEADKINNAVQRLRKTMTIVVPRTVGYGQIRTMTIGITADNREMAAAIPNMILDELMIYNQTVRVTKAKDNLDFIEQQLKKTQDLLKTAESEYSSFLMKNRKIGDDLAIERDRLKRNVKVQEDLYIQLSKQIELAKIEEQEKRPTIEVLERARPPRSKFKPAVRRGVIMAAFLGFFVSCGLAFVLEMTKKIDKNDETSRAFLRNIEDIKNDAAKVGRLVGLGKKGKKRAR